MMDLRDRRPLSWLAESADCGGSLDLGVRWKNDGVRLVFGLVPDDSVEAVSVWESALESGCSTSLSFCRMSRPSEATLARRREPDLEGRLEVGAASDAEAERASEAVSSERTSATGEAIISSTGSTMVHCIATSWADEPREAASLRRPRLGWRTARAATSASSWMRGLSGDLGVRTFSLLSPPLVVETKLWLAVMLGLFAEPARNMSEASEVEREPSQTLGSGGTGGMAACLDVSASSWAPAATSCRPLSEASPEASLLPLMRLEREAVRAIAGFPTSGLPEADRSLEMLLLLTAEVRREPPVMSFCGSGGS